MKRPAPFLPAAEHVAYLANLLTLLALGYAAYYVWRHDRDAERGQRTYAPAAWRAG